MSFLSPFDQSVTLTLPSGGEYDLHLYTTPPQGSPKDEGSLHVELEHLETQTHWSSVFSSNQIKKLTHIAGAVKSLSMVVKMLSVALEGSESVWLDVLTPHGMQMLNMEPFNVPSDARILVISHQTEFESLNYPFTLLVEHTPSLGSMQRKIAQLRMELKEAKAMG